MSELDATRAALAVLRGHHDEIPYGERGDHIRALQSALKARGFDPQGIDGVFGLHTEDALQAALAEQTQPELSEPDLTDHAVVRYDAPGGLDLRSTRHGGSVTPRPNGKDRYIAKRGETPRVLVLHWTAGPTSAKKLRDGFANTSRAVSSHFAVDPSGAYQYLPFSAWAYHATWINRFAVGIDVCQPVQAKRLQSAKAAGYDTKVVANPTKRGEAHVLALDEAVAARTRALVFEVAAALDIPLRAPRDASGKVHHGVAFADALQLGAWSGVVGHHHVDARKWDMACWWDAIFGGTELG